MQTTTLLILMLVTPKISISMFCSTTWAFCKNKVYGKLFIIKYESCLKLVTFIIRILSSIWIAIFNACRVLLFCSHFCRSKPYLTFSSLISKFFLDFTCFKVNLKRRDKNFLFIVLDYFCFSLLAPIFYNYSFTRILVLFFSDVSE